MCAACGVCRVNLEAEVRIEPGLVEEFAGLDGLVELKVHEGKLPRDLLIVDLLRRELRREDLDRHLHTAVRSNQHDTRTTRRHTALPARALGSGGSLTNIFSSMW